VTVVLGIDSALGCKPLDDGVEGVLAGQSEIEEHAGLARLGLRADKSGRRPRSFKAETAALEDADLDAVGGEPPRHRASDYAAADYESLHVFTEILPMIRLTARWGWWKRAGGRIGIAQTRRR